jgi:hypothetical protein
VSAQRHRCEDERVSESDKEPMLLILARDRPDVLRMKVVGKSRIRRRRIYRLELLKGRQSLWSDSTDVPVNTIEPAVGMQEAWALTHEADRLWDSKLGDWVAFAIGPG